MNLESSQLTGDEEQSYLRLKGIAIECIYYQD